MSVTEGVGKVQSGSFVQYRLLCGCGNPRCGLSLTTDYDAQSQDVEVWLGPVSPTIWSRIKLATKILFTGRAHVLHVSTCDHLYGIIGALLEARRCMQQAGKPFRQVGRLEDRA